MRFARLAVSAACLAGLFGAVVPVATAGDTSRTFDDRAGDSNWAPDVTKVSVSSDETGRITFRIDLGNRSRPKAGDYIGIMLDTDRNAATGGSSVGGDYVLATSASGVKASKWSVGELTYETARLPSLSGAYSNEHATFSVDRRDLGNTKGFHFMVVALGGGFEKLVVDSAPDAGSKLWTYELESGPARTPPAVVPATGTEGTPSPSRGEAATLHAKIAFEREGELWVMDPDGSHQRQLETGVSGVESPAWSPDGRWILFVGSSDLYVVRSDGSGLRKLTGGVADGSTPAWSPDGSRIALESAGDILIVDVASGRSKLVGTGADGSVVAWSPDGKRIAFAGSNGLFVVGSTGRGLRRLASGEDYGPAWSPDGKRIAFVTRVRSGSNDYQDEIGVVGANGKGRIHFRELSGQRVGFPPAWSPDGTRLVFQSGSESMFLSGYDISVANADGTGVRDLGTAGFDSSQHPAWSSDGTWIYFLSTKDTKNDSYCHDVYAINLQTGSQRRLTTSTENASLMESGVDSFSLSAGTVQASGTGFDYVQAVEIGIGALLGAGLLVLFFLARRESPIHPRHA